MANIQPKTTCPCDANTNERQGGADGLQSKRQQGNYERAKTVT